MSGKVNSTAFLFSSSFMSSNSLKKPFLALAIVDAPRRARPPFVQPADTDATAPRADPSDDAPAAPHAQRPPRRPWEEDCCCGCETPGASTAPRRPAAARFAARAARLSRAAITGRATTLMPCMIMTYDVSGAAASLRALCQPGTRARRATEVVQRLCFRGFINGNRGPR